MSAIPNLFKFTDWAGFTPEDREQRVLNEKRVPDLRDYILNNEDDYLFSSITASYKSEPTYEELKNGDDGSLGVLRLKLGDDLIINDGQHRAAGITAALKDNPALDETGYWVRFVVLQVPATADKPHGLDYTLTMDGPDGGRLVGFDNAHQVAGQRGRAPAAKDHKHRLSTVRPYDYTDAGALLAAFWKEVESVMRENGVWT